MAAYVLSRSGEQPLGQGLYESLRDRGYCRLAVELDPAANSTARLLSWQSTVQRAFSQEQSVKEAVGGYRADQAVAVGYRVEDQREFFETRLYRPGLSVNPSFPEVDDYDQTVVDLFECLSRAGALCRGCSRGHLVGSAKCLEPD